MNEKFAQLISKYEALPEHEMNILKLLSIELHIIDKSKFVKIINRLYYFSGNIKFTFKNIVPCIDKLQKLELIKSNDDKVFYCNPLIINYLLHTIVLEKTLDEYVDAIRKILPEDKYMDSNEQIKWGRIFLYQGKSIEKKIFSKNNYMDIPFSHNIINTIVKSLESPLQKEILNSGFVLKEYVDIYFINHIEDVILQISPETESIKYCIENCTKPKDILNSKIAYKTAEYLLFCDRKKEIEQILNNYKSIGQEFIIFQFIQLFIQGNFSESFITFSTLVKEFPNSMNQFSYLYYFYFLIILKEEKTKNFKNINSLILSIKEYKIYELDEISKIYNSFFSHLSVYDPSHSLFDVDIQYKNVFELLSYSLMLYWLNDQNKKQILSELKSKLSIAKKQNFKWFIAQFSDLIEKIEDRKITDIQKDSSIFLSNIMQKREKWSEALKALKLIHSSKKAVRDTVQSKRLVWSVHLNQDKSIYIQPIEQSYSKAGWSSGKNVALKRLKNKVAEIDFLNDIDRKIISCIKVYRNGYYGDSEYSIESDQAIVQMVGHPNLYWKDSQTRFDLVQVEPEIKITELPANKEILLEIIPKKKPDKDFVLERESANKLKLVLFSSEHTQVANILEKGLKVPASAKESVKETLSSLSGLVNILSDSDLELSDQSEKVISSSIITVQLLPFGNGLKLFLFVRPFQDGPYYKPAKGGKNLLTEVNGKKLQTTRDFEKESQNVNELLENCPILQKISSTNEQEWELYEPEDCLQVLLELQERKDTILIEWPEGEKFKIKSKVTSSMFHGSIRKSNDWFELSGELKISEKEVIEMQSLLELLNHSQGKFVKLNDGSFLALAEGFKKQLEELQAYTEKSKSGYKISSFTIPLIDELTQNLENLKIDKEWTKQIQSLRDLNNYKPKLPNTFNAELRDYQLQGFEWLSRLSKWGVGACLADDMGLGKTVQALAILVENASKGPSLVIAPTSVCFNWISEAIRFAPTLTSLQFGFGNREKMIQNLKPYDLVLCTYGLIQQEEVSNLLQTVNWSVLILDEAQAIKNMSTKRSQAVMNLHADFKVITTGTPIENHLGELWNLFRFLNPGLLGSLESFNKRFAYPIERDHDKSTRLKLKRLIQPFILRRMKNDVLEELPEKTEIVHHIELSKEEAAFYETLRQEALKKLSKNSDIKEGQKQLQIFAEIMKLRRACCNSSLVNPKIQIKSSKLEAFQEILEELLENKHKVLVFSQFIDHLDIIKKYLESQNIQFQYLDGSTPMKERQRSVEAFQSGEGDVFLISLKAGGSGLNLTAADFVIHMDPWWNPAVEDQASDRAHRIGQNRPVTVYRLVTKDTIEEKIIELHKHKRDLATSLLSETDMSGKINAEELLKLLKEG